MIIRQQATLPSMKQPISTPVSSGKETLSGLQLKSSSPSVDTVSFSGLKLPEKDELAKHHPMSAKIVDWLFEGKNAQMKNPKRIEYALKKAEELYKMEIVPDIQKTFSGIIVPQGINLKDIFSADIGDLLSGKLNSKQPEVTSEDYLQAGKFLIEYTHKQTMRQLKKAAEEGHPPSEKDKQFLNNLQMMHKEVSSLLNPHLDYEQKTFNFDILAEYNYKTLLMLYQNQIGIRICC